MGIKIVSRASPFASLAPPGPEVSLGLLCMHASASGVKMGEAEVLPLH
eukprot:NODE_3307_length_370_cov_60.697819_g3225_i0.p3 GENE.NODE_3307_length_370_cov_60.697819_g3225_i0~~NODE_3307_length_370_cov_60.697819_g3225_i0.p3  ORF type:complete len:58 (+),score=26.38 NODE_3307_length_370_cov_60.697819_g3225_i0:31-174(+)